jgi:hypothetical protein
LLPRDERYVINRRLSQWASRQHRLGNELNQLPLPSAPHQHTSSSTTGAMRSSGTMSPSSHVRHTPSHYSGVRPIPSASSFDNTNAYAAHANDHRRDSIGHSNVLSIIQSTSAGGISSGSHMDRTSSPSIGGVLSSSSSSIAASYSSMPLPPQGFVYGFIHALPSQQQLQHEPSHVTSSSSVRSAPQHHHAATPLMAASPSVPPSSMSSMIGLPRPSVLLSSSPPTSTLSAVSSIPTSRVLHRMIPLPSSSTRSS